MSDANALLAAAWSTSDLTPLLALADMLDEQNHADFAELLRLTIAEGQTARRNITRHRQLQDLRADAWDRRHHLHWPDLATLPGAAMSFSKLIALAWPNREQILVRADRHTMHWFRSEMDSSDEVIRTRQGDELLRCRLSNERNLMAWKRCHNYEATAFTLVEDFFPISDTTTDRKAAEVEQLRLFEEAVAPARIEVAELPSELVPFVAWLLADHATDRTRRVKNGEVVPGTHLFIFRHGAWRYEESLHSRDFGRPHEVLRQRLSRNARDAVRVGLLVRVLDDGSITAKKLLWLGTDGHRQETDTLPRPSATLSRATFQKVAERLKLSDAAFVLDTPETLRALFDSR